jgi:putative Holliday junction resolvase
VRYLAIDLGDKRTGLAVGDVILRMAAPLDVLEIPIERNKGQDLLAALRKVIDEHNPAGVVVGLPLNMDGTEGPRAQSVRAFIDRLAPARPTPIHWQDERLTTAQADWQMARSGLTHAQKKSKRDALAAAALLQDFLNTQAH